MIAVVVEGAVVDDWTGVVAVEAVSQTVLADAVLECERVGLVAVDIGKITAAVAAIPQDAVLEDAYPVISTRAIAPDIAPIAGCRRCCTAIVVRIAAVGIVLYRSEHDFIG